MRQYHCSISLLNIIAQHNCSTQLLNTTPFTLADELININFLPVSMKVWPPKWSRTMSWLIFSVDSTPAFETTVMTFPR